MSNKSLTLDQAISLIESADAIDVAQDVYDDPAICEFLDDGNELVFSWQDRYGQHSLFFEKDRFVSATLIPDQKQTQLDYLDDSDEEECLRIGFLGKYLPELG